jgi:hypothetical protein
LEEKQRKKRGKTYLDDPVRKDLLCLLRSGTFDRTTGFTRLVTLPQFQCRLLRTGKLRRRLVELFFQLGSASFGVFELKSESVEIVEVGVARCRLAFEVGREALLLGFGGGELLLHRCEAGRRFEVRRFKLKSSRGVRGSLGAKGVVLVFSGGDGRVEVRLEVDQLLLKSVAVGSDVGELVLEKEKVAKRHHLDRRFRLNDILERTGSVFVKDLIVLDGNTDGEVELKKGNSIFVLTDGRVSLRDPAGCGCENE